ncbi:hypothetical protein AB0L13_47520, partial [Saccharopolyspora shandongensis]|uniref:hypothetical protein n=1 Tax=Saccharopolyspora shandongensis TaxID=418495 RepID=UPI00342DAF5D
VPAALVSGELEPTPPDPADGRRVVITIEFRPAGPYKLSAADAGPMADSEVLSDAPTDGQQLSDQLLGDSDSDGSDNGDDGPVELGAPVTTTIPEVTVTLVGTAGGRSREFQAEDVRFRQVTGDDRRTRGLTLGDETSAGQLLEWINSGGLDRTIVVRRVEGGLAPKLDLPSPWTYASATDSRVFVADLRGWDHKLPVEIDGRVESVEVEMLATLAWAVIKSAALAQARSEPGAPLRSIVLLLDEDSDEAATLFANAAADDGLSETFWVSAKFAQSMGSPGYGLPPAALTTDDYWFSSGAVTDLEAVTEALADPQSGEDRPDLARVIGIARTIVTRSQELLAESGVLDLAEIDRELNRTEPRPGTGEMELSYSAALSYLSEQPDISSTVRSVTDRWRHSDFDWIEVPLSGMARSLLKITGKGEWTDRLTRAADLVRWDEPGLTRVDLSAFTHPAVTLPLDAGQTAVGAEDVTRHLGALARWVAEATHELGGTAHPVVTVVGYGADADTGKRSADEAAYHLRTLLNANLLILGTTAPVWPQRVVPAAEVSSRVAGDDGSKVVVTVRVDDRSLAALERDFGAVVHPRADVEVLPDAEIDVVRAHAPVNEIRERSHDAERHHRVRRIEVRPGVWVREFTLKLYLDVASDTGWKGQRQFWPRLLATVADHFNQGLELPASGDHLRLRVVRADDPADADVRVPLYASASSGRPRRDHWRADDRAPVLTQRILELLGVSRAAAGSRISVDLTWSNLLELDLQHPRGALRSLAHRDIPAGSGAVFLNARDYAARDRKVTEQQIVATPLMYRGQVVGASFTGNVRRSLNAMAWVGSQERANALFLEEFGQTGRYLPVQVPGLDSTDARILVWHANERNGVFYADGIGDVRVDGASSAHIARSVEAIANQPEGGLVLLLACSVGALPDVGGFAHDFEAAFGPGSRRRVMAGSSPVAADEGMGLVESWAPLVFVGNGGHFNMFGATTVEDDNAVVVELVSALMADWHYAPSDKRDDGAKIPLHDRAATLGLMRGIVAGLRDSVLVRGGDLDLVALHAGAAARHDRPGLVTAAVLGYVASNPAAVPEVRSVTDRKLGPDGRWAEFRLSELARSRFTVTGPSTWDYGTGEHRRPVELVPLDKSRPLQLPATDQMERGHLAAAPVDSRRDVWEKKFGELSKWLAKGKASSDSPTSAEVLAIANEAGVHQLNIDASDAAGRQRYNDHLAMIGKALLESRQEAKDFARGLVDYTDAYQHKTRVLGGAGPFAQRRDTAGLPGWSQPTGGFGALAESSGSHNVPHTDIDPALEDLPESPATDPMDVDPTLSGRLSIVGEFTPLKRIEGVGDFVPNLMDSLDSQVPPVPRRSSLPDALVFGVPPVPRRSSLPDALVFGVPPVPRRSSLPDSRIWFSPRPSLSSLTPERRIREFGLPDRNYDRLRNFADRFGVVLDARPTNPDSVPWLLQGAIPKPVEIKAKTINALDVHLGASKDHIGLVGYFRPEMPSERDLASMSDQQRGKVERRFQDRQREFESLNDEMLRHSMSKKFRVTNGVVEGRGSAGEYRPVTGDLDLFHVRLPDSGAPLSEQDYDNVIYLLTNMNVGVQHGAHMYWRPDGAFQQKIFDDIVAKHQSGYADAEPLIRFSPGEEPSLVFADDAGQELAAERGHLAAAPVDSRRDAWEEKFVELLEWLERGKWVSEVDPSAEVLKIARVAGVLPRLDISTEGELGEQHRQEQQRFRRDLALIARVLVEDGEQAAGVFARGLVEFTDSYSRRGGLRGGAPTPASNQLSTGEVAETSALTSHAGSSEAADRFGHEGFFGDKAEALELMHSMADEFDVTFDSNEGAAALKVQEERKFQAGAKSKEESTSQNWPKRRKWVKAQLLGVADALQNYAPILGAQRQNSSRRDEPQEVTTFGALASGANEQRLGMTAAEYIASHGVVNLYFESMMSRAYTGDRSNARRETAAIVTHELAHGLLKYALPDFKRAIDCWDKLGRPVYPKGLEKTATFAKTAESDLKHSLVLLLWNPERFKQLKPVRHAALVELRSRHPGAFELGTGELDTVAATNKSEEIFEALTDDDIRWFNVATGMWTANGQHRLVGEQPITEYAATNANEDLSETAAYYFLEPELLRDKCPQRYAFLANLVAEWTRGDDGGPDNPPKPSPAPDAPGNDVGGHLNVYGATTAADDRLVVTELVEALSLGWK